MLVRQLGVMVGAGLPLAESLAVLYRQEEHPRLRTTVERIAREVESGSSLAAAMSRHPRVFSRLAVAMTSIGETGGRLDRSLLRLATELEKAAAVSEQVRGAFAYPLVVGAIGVLVVSVILWRVVPVFSELYEGLDAELPPPDARGGGCVAVAGGMGARGSECPGRWNGGGGALPADRRRRRPL